MKLNFWEIRKLLLQREKWVLRKGAGYQECMCLEKGVRFFFGCEGTCFLNNEGAIPYYPNNFAWLCLRPAVRALEKYLQGQSASDREELLSLGSSAPSSFVGGIELQKMTEWKDQWQVNCQAAEQITLRTRAECNQWREIAEGLVKRPFHTDECQESSLSGSQCLCGYDEILDKLADLTKRVE